MRIRVNQDTLLKGIQAVQNAVATRATLPILSNLLVETRGTKLRIVGTDLDLGLETEIEVVKEEDGSTTVPGRRFGEIVRELPPGEVTLHARKNNTLTIECGRAYFRILGQPAEEFPQLPSFDTGDALSIGQELLREMFRLTAFAVSRDEARYVLNGILVRIGGKRLRMVATDGRRLAMVERELQEPTGVEREFILPIKAVQELTRILTTEENVEVRLAANQVVFRLQSVRLISRLIEGKFPDYERVIPKEAERKLRISREEFLLATRRVGILSTQSSPAIRLEISGERLVISKDSPELGESRDEVPVTYQGEALTVGFNPTYLTDVLRNLDEEEIDFELTSSDKPGVIRMDGRYLYIILPMELQS